MLDILYSIFCFFTASAAFLLTKSYAENVTIRFLSNHKLKKRLNELNGAQKHDSTIDDDDNESIGLSNKGPKFSSGLFNTIASYNQDLIEEMQQLLMQAGKRGEKDLDEFMHSKFYACIALFFIVLLVLTTNNFGYDISFMECFIASLLLGAYGGHKLTNLDMSIIANKRKDAIENGVPDLIDLMVICTESGLDLNRAIQRISREMRTSNPILAEELSLTSIELEMIPDHRVAFENLEKRTNSLQVKSISKTLSQSIEYGSSLATSLRELAVESRQRRMLTAEAKAAQAPTLLTLPMMIFILPCLFIVMIGPVIIGVIETFK